MTPRSHTSTRMRSNALAIRIFSSRVIDAPGLCSPSRKVVSKIMSLSSAVMILAPVVAPRRFSDVWTHGAHTYQALADLTIADAYQLEVRLT
jgi:hypothetical protein